MLLRKKIFFLKGDTDVRFMRSGKKSIALIVHWSISMNFICFIFHTYVCTCAQTYSLALFTVRPRNKDHSRRIEHHWQSVYEL